MSQKPPPPDRDPMAFLGEEAKADGLSVEPVGVKCPSCKARDWDVLTGTYGVQRTCRKCGHQWFGGPHLPHSDPLAGQRLNASGMPQRDEEEAIPAVHLGPMWDGDW